MSVCVSATGPSLSRHLQNVGLIYMLLLGRQISVCIQCVGIVGNVSLEKYRLKKVWEY